MASRHMSLPLVFALTTICGALSFTACPKGWMANEGSCYLFGTQPVHFTEAEAFCRKHGAHLVEVRDAHENTFIKDRCRDFKNRHWWLGLTDEESEGEWKWFHTGVITSFTDWYPGQPDGKDGDCAMFTYDRGFRWYDTTCLTNAAPICEIARAMCNTGNGIAAVVTTTSTKIN